MDIKILLGKYITRITINLDIFVNTKRVYRTVEIFPYKIIFWTSANMNTKILQIEDIIKPINNACKSSFNRITSQTIKFNKKKAVISKITILIITRHISTTPIIRKPFILSTMSAITVA